MVVRSGYKRTEVGVIPEEWEVKQVTDFCGFIVPGRNKPKCFGGDIPWITTPDLDDGGYVSESKSGLFVTRNEAKNVGSKIVPTNSIIMTCVGELGIVAIAKKDVVLNQQLHAFIPSSDVVALFLMYSIKTRQSYLESIATKTALPYLNKENCNSIQVPFPPLSEQRAIAAALSDVDALIASLDRLITKKRDMKQAAMQKLLTGKRRLSGFSEEWEVKRLGDVVDKIIGGGTPSRSNPAYWGDEIPWVTVKDFATFNPISAQEAITKEGLKNSSSNLIPKGTLITSTRMALGKAVIYEVDVSINQDLKAIFPKQDISSLFLFYWFQTHAEYIESLGSGSTVMGISLVDLKNITFNKPPLPEQTAIATILSDMDTEIAALEQKRDKTRMLKKGMMQELLTGKIRLKP